MKVGGLISQNKQTNLRISQGGVLSITIFLVVIKGILEELGYGMEASFFAEDLEIYILTRNQRVASRALQEVTKTKSWMHRQQRGARPFLP